MTAVELALHPLGDEVMAGLVLHPVERARELLALFRDVTLDAPEELGLAFAFITAPPEEGVPEELHGRPAVMVAGLYAGPVGEGEEALSAIRAFGPPAADFFAPTPYADFNRSLDDPPGYRNYWTAELLRDLPDAAIDAIATRAQDLPPGPAQVFIVPWGGAVARVGQDASPLAGRDARFVVHPLLLWEGAADDETVIAHGRAYREDLRPYATGAAYHNFLGDEGPDRGRAGFGAAAGRLARVKAEWDPENVFRGSNQHLEALRAAA